MLPVNSAKDEDDSCFYPPQSRWGRSPSSSDNVSITFENSFPRPVRVYWVDFEGELKNYGTIPPQWRYVDLHLCRSSMGTRFLRQRSDRYIYRLQL